MYFFMITFLQAIQKNGEQKNIKKKKKGFCIRHCVWLSQTQIGFVSSFHCSVAHLCQAAVGGLTAQKKNHQPCGHFPFDPFHPEVSEWSDIDFKKCSGSGLPYSQYAAG